MTREQIVLRLVDRSGKGLEIGPSYNPIAPKSQGWSVETVDHLDAERLREKYAAWGVDPSKVEEVDHVIADKSLAETVGKRDYFDFVIASHVIEHTPDFVGFLKDCQRLLKPNGVLSLAVPDKRFCFDVFQSLTTTGMVFQAHHEERKRHSPGTIFDAYANHIMADGALVGFDRMHPHLQLVHDIRQSTALTRAYIGSGAFTDTHAWNFTPSSFLLIIQDLCDMGLIDLGTVAFHETIGFEFFVSLRKGMRQRRYSRIQLLRDVSTELSGRPPEPRRYGSTKLPQGTEPIFTFSGHCPICETDVSFVTESRWFRDNLLCDQCLSVPRERAVMHMIETTMPGWRGVAIHESPPSDRATSRKLRHQAPGYVASQFDPKLARGTVHPTLGYRSEDLAAQTFADESFDIVVTQDVFEQVSDPAASIREIARTLRPGGVHIASVPLVRKWQPSFTRVRLTPDGKYEYLLPPDYHGNPVDPSGSLVVTDWGYDIAAFFKQHSGMDTVIMQIDNINLGIRAEFIEVVVSRKAG
jgi:2-polyprenyl-3-methyl-5-hydroxy-6-metoxy-1,4-benzoquinol methylase